MGVVKANLAFTAAYNLVGLGLAALGFLPPILAAAVQFLPDLGILANSSRLLRQNKALNVCAWPQPIDSKKRIRNPPAGLVTPETD